MELKKLCAVDPRIVRLGRYAAGEKTPELWWSGSGIRMCLKGSALEAEFETEACEHLPWVGVMLDGAPVARFPLTPGVRRYPILMGMDPAIAHEVTIQRDTSPTDGDTNYTKLTQLFTDGTLEACEPRPRTIEFLGDSLTVGEGCLGPVCALEWRMVLFSNMHAFPKLVSEALNAEQRVMAHGGWGVWQSWNGDPRCRIGRIYDQLCGVLPQGQTGYAFDQGKADAVVIGLGTNDATSIRSKPEEEKDAVRKEVTECAVELISKVRQHEPQAVIVWCYGLCGEELRVPLEEAVRRANEAGDANVYYLPLSDANGDIGSENHPGQGAHKRAAQEISDFLREKLG